MTSALEPYRGHRAFIKVDLRHARVDKDLHSEVQRPVMERLMQVSSMDDPVRRSKVVAKLWDELCSTDGPAVLPSSHVDGPRLDGGLFEELGNAPAFEMTSDVRCELDTGTDLC
jgi:hypothetical protein